MRLAVITTHPIQYYAPVFKLITERNNLQLKVFYTLGAESNSVDAGFEQNVQWDIPLLKGYQYEFVKNTSQHPSSAHFKGIVNPSLITRIKTFKADVVLVYGWSYDSHLKVLRYFKDKIPVIFRGDSTLLDNPNNLKATLRYLFLIWVYRHIDYAIYNGINNKAYFKKHSVQEHQLFFAPHAVDNERFAQPRLAEVTELRKSFSVHETDILILFAGKFEAKKNPLLLLEAFKQIKKSNVHLLFVGDGQLKEQLITNSTLIDNVHFLSFANQSYMPVIYQSCDLFCLPSQGPGETWGLAVNEAMACKKAILVSDKVGCAIDLVKDGNNGAIFKSGDVNELVVQLSKLVDSKIRLQKMGQESEDLIADWSFVEVAKSIEAIVRRIEIDRTNKIT